MNEPGVDDAVSRACTAAQTLGIFQIASMHHGSSGLERRRSGVRAGQADNLVAPVQQFRNDRGADEPGGARDEYTHD